MADMSERSEIGLYSMVNTHMITALMFHDQMADMYDFLNLHGFKRMHEYQHLAESLEHRKLKRYVLNHHNMLVMDENIENPSVIPLEWYNYNRFDVTPQVREQSIKKSFQRYKEWESNTKDMYNSVCKVFFEHGKVADFEHVSCLLSDVDIELKCLERLELELESCNYSMEYILTLQPDLHEKYKKKTKELFI